MKKLAALVTMKKGKTTINEWKNDDSDILRNLNIVYKKIGIFFPHTYFLTCLNIHV